MTAIATTEPSLALASRRAGEIEPIPLTRITSVELRKMFDTRSGFWLIASIAITAVLATGAVILFAPDDQLVYANFAGAIGIPMTVILPVIAILSVTSEWSQRNGLTTFTLIPHRGRPILAKAIATVAIAVASMVVALAIGAVGNVIGAAITGVPLTWDISVVEFLDIVLGNVLGLLVGFMLGVLIRNSPGAIVAYFVYSLVLPTLSSILAANAAWFESRRPWLDFNFAQAALFDGNLSGQQWAQLAVTSVIWLVLPLLVGLGLVLRAEVK